MSASQSQSEAISGNQSLSEPIQANPSQSVAIRGTHLRGKLLELTRRLERAQEAHHTARAQALHRVVTGAQAAHIRQLRRAQRGGGAVLGACAGRLPGE